MIEQIGNPLKAGAFFVATKQGKTGLTVTVDVYRDWTKIVTAGSASAIGDGIYTYTLSAGSVTVEGVYLFLFKTADTSVDQQHLIASYLVGSAGIENLDTTVSSRLAASAYTGAPTASATAAQVRTELATELARIDTTISSRGTLTANQVWTNASRTLTMTSAEIAVAIAATGLTATRGDDWQISLTDLPDMSDRDEVWLTIKSSVNQADTLATVKINTGGLDRLNGADASARAANGALSFVSDTAIDVILAAVESAELIAKPYVYDVQMRTNAGKVSTLRSGVFTIDADVTREI